MRNKLDAGIKEIYRETFYWDDYKMCDVVAARILGMTLDEFNHAVENDHDFPKRIPKLKTQYFYSHHILEFLEHRLTKTEHRNMYYKKKAELYKAFKKISDAQKEIIGLVYDFDEAMQELWVKERGPEYERSLLGE